GAGAALVGAAGGQGRQRLRRRGRDLDRRGGRGGRRQQVGPARNDHFLADHDPVGRAQPVRLHDGLGGDIVFAGDGVERLAAGDGVGIAIAIAGGLHRHAGIEGQRGTGGSGAQRHGGGGGRQRGKGLLSGHGLRGS